MGDEDQLYRVFINIIKNADESIAEIINKFGKALKELGGTFDDNLVSLEMNKMSEQIAAE